MTAKTPIKEQMGPKRSKITFVAEATYLQNSNQGVGEQLGLAVYGLVKM